MSLLVVPCAAHAQVVITEIMYDLSEGSDSGREWIEIRNDGDSIDLTEWKFFENSVNHGITAIGSAEVPSGAYAVIADNATKFKADWPAYGGLLFDSAFSLNNTGETLVMRCCGKELSDVDSVTYASDVGGNGDGLTLHREGDALVPAKPSPGSSAIVRPDPPKPPPPPAPAPAPTPAPEPAPESTVKAEPATAPPASIPEIPNERAVTAEDAAPLEPLAETPVIVPKKKAERAPEGVSVTRVEPEVRAAPVAEVPVHDAATGESEPASIDDSETQVLVAAASESVPSDKDDAWLWWMTALVVAGAGGVAVRYLRTLQSKEWEIEEMQ